jgi:cysteinyl-tRNA synthetase
MGGGDLIFPHHENEIAQSEAATGVPLSTYWMHNGMVNVGGEKMSKSLGNFTTVRDLLDKAQIDPMALRLFVLGGQYRKPIDFTDEAITAATNGWATLKTGLLFGPELGESLGWAKDHDGLDETAIAAFERFMDDDFNSAGALSVLYELAKSLQREANLLTHQGKTSLDNAQLQCQWLTLTKLAEVLGLTAMFEQTPVAEGGLSDGAIEQLIADRASAKATKDFKQADAIRDELKAAGINLIDQPGGLATWHRS